MPEFRAVLTAADGVPGEALERVGALLAAQGRSGRPPVSEMRPVHLSPRAAEIRFRAGQAPDRADLDPGGSIDLNILEARARPPAILIADMDSTMIGVECIDELADYAGVKAEVAAITERAMRGELDFEEAIHARVALLTDLPVTALQTCYDARVTLNPGAETLVRRMAASGARCALVSGGFTFFTERVAAAAGFHLNRANTLEIAGDRLTGRVVPPILGQAAKAEALAELCAQTGATPADVIAIGDGANDLAMIRAAGLGVAYRAKPALRAEADAILDHSDLSAVLVLAGLPG